MVCKCPQVSPICVCECFSPPSVDSALSTRSSKPDLMEAKSCAILSGFGQMSWIAFGIGVDIEFPGPGLICGLLVSYI